MSCPIVVLDLCDCMHFLRRLNVTNFRQHKRLITLAIIYVVFAFLVMYVD